MCGIAGLMMKGGRAVEPDILAALGQALSHRGPDGMGFHQEADIGLVQTRLAIIDLEGGRQPLYGPDGLVLVANGEIYNDPDLRHRLADRPFRTQSDCEPLLYLYQQHGIDFVQALRGMYAIALYDPAKRRLILARDPFGIKPLYYAETPAGLAFASEPQALIAAGLVRAHRNAQATAELLQTNFTMGRATIFAGIDRVLPGETLVIEGGQIVERHSLPALPQGSMATGQTPLLSESQALLRLDEILTRSVGLHQRADVPYGMFLSGGIDSAALLALMARLNPNPVLAFTAGFADAHVHDERDHARALARKTGAEHIEIEVSRQDFWDLLPQIAAAMDDPAADYAIVPTYKLARVAASHVTVILSGEGGDEMFGGYGRYRSAMRPWPFRKSMRRKGVFQGLGLLRDDTMEWRRRIVESERIEAIRGRSSLQIAQAVDCADWLPNDLLGKLDRCLMANGLEGRVPFLDKDVAAFAFALPDAMKVRKSLGKWLLRRWLMTALPEAKPFARKRGFTVPVADWLSDSPSLGDLLAKDEAIQEIAHPEAVRRLFGSIGKKTGFAAWSLLFYALWHRRHMRGLIPQGGIMDVLADRS